jgi:hypothetical protein
LPPAQNLHLLINLLSRIGSQTRLTPEQLDAILAWSRQEAGEHVAKKNDALHQAVSDWLAGETEPPREEETEAMPGANE